MAKNTRGIPGEIAAQLNTLEKNQHGKRNRNSLGNVALPGGLEISIEELIGSEIRPDNLYFHTDYTKPEAFLKHPRDDCKYVWKVFARKDGIRADAHRADTLSQGIRAGAYRVVSIDEMVDDANLPISTVEMIGDKVGGNVDAIVLKGLILVEVQPKAVSDEYKQRELIAAMRANPRLGENLMRNSLASYGVDEELVHIETVEKDPEVNSR